MIFEITIPGMVQGIGFRPFVAETAEEMGISGTVCNSGGIVTITCEVEKTEVLEEFTKRLRFSHPQGAKVSDIRVRELDSEKAEEIKPGFAIVRSSGDRKGYLPYLPTDISICPKCRQEMDDTGNRRFRYPFISCTLCGPRYSIIEKIPYDRENITMADFDMCPECAAEYIKKGDRRRHAQTISCHDCGPQLMLAKSILVQENGQEHREYVQTLQGEEALRACIQELKQEKVLFLKGIGGYQLVCLATSETASEAIRTIKGREEKPFAVMFPDMETLREYAEVSEGEEELLKSSAAPIVLLRTKEAGRKTAPSVCKKSDLLGAFLPYTGLHILLTRACGPLVVTSCNQSASPILTSDEEVFPFAVESEKRVGSEKIGGVAWNSRRIVTPLDDSVSRIFRQKPLWIRRSRGVVPEPVFLKKELPGSFLAMGGDLKSAFALGAKDRVYMSQYFGDLEDYGVHKAYENGIPHMESLLSLTPDRILCDLHPGYVSAATGGAMGRKTGIPVQKIQHHEAHVASVMAEYGIRDCIGVALDGTGYGWDGAIWGSEFFLCREGKMERKAHLSYTKLAGGDVSSKNTRRNALCQLLGAGLDKGLEKDPETSFLRAALSHGVGVSENGSMGRLFDAVAALIGLGDYNHYEGECACMLEQAAYRALQKGLSPVPMQFWILEDPKGSLILDRTPILDACLKPDFFMRDQRNYGAEEAEYQERLALGFHLALADTITDTCRRIREASGEAKVALGGGCFANMLLLERTVKTLEKEGFEVLINRRVPGNDSGIALGQIYLASLSGDKLQETQPEENN